MSRTTDMLLAELDDYCMKWRRAGKRRSPSTVSYRAVKDSNLPARLHAGGDCATGQVERIRQYMADNPPPVAEPCEEQERSAA